MGDHKRSNKFKNIGFDYKILEESTDRNYIEKREEYWIKRLKTFTEGLNSTILGKGYGHNSPRFTTLGYTFSEDSRKKMSEAAKRRGGGSEQMRELSLNQWKDPKMRKHHSDIRKGKRLRKPKLSDEIVAEIRNRYKIEYDILMNEVMVINEERHKKNPSWNKVTPHRHFANKYAKEYGVSNTLLVGIVTNKTRTEILPCICKS